MKKNLLISFMLFIAISIKVYAQCEFTKEKYAHNKFEPYGIQIDKMTGSYRLLWDKKTEATFEFAKNQSNYYLIVQYKRSNGKWFGVLKNNSLDFIFDNGEKIQLYPIVDYPGGIGSPLTSFFIECIFAIDIQQLLMLGDNYPAIISLHYTADKEQKGSHVDEEGRYSFDCDISKYEFRKNTTLLSRCILNN